MWLEHVGACDPGQNRKVTFQLKSVDSSFRPETLGDSAKEWKFLNGLKKEACWKLEVFNKALYVAYKQEVGLAWLKLFELGACPTS